MTTAAGRSGGCAPAGDGGQSLATTEIPLLACALCAALIPLILAVVVSETAGPSFSVPPADVVGTLSPSSASSLPQSAETEVDGLFALVAADKYRHEGFAAGFDARIGALNSVQMPQYYWTWDAEQASAHLAGYSRCQRCVAPQFSTAWGEYSALRDFSDFVIDALTSGRFGVEYLKTMRGVYRLRLDQCACGRVFAPPRPRARDKEVVTPGQPFVDRVEGFFWPSVCALAGCVLRDITGAPVAESALAEHSVNQRSLLYLGAIRSMVWASGVLSATDIVVQGADALLAEFRDAQLPMLAIHVRRTDKSKDFSKMDHRPQHAVLREFLSAITKEQPIPSLQRIGALVRSIEDGGQRFRSVFFMADDARFYAEDVLAHVQGFFTRRQDLRVFLGKWSRRNTRSDSFAVSSSVVAASRFSSHIVGMGTSAVSQAIAQRIAGRLGVSPHAISLWEEPSLANVSALCLAHPSLLKRAKVCRGGGGG